MINGPKDQSPPRSPFLRAAKFRRRRSDINFDQPRHVLTGVEKEKGRSGKLEEKVRRIAGKMVWCEKQ